MRPSLVTARHSGHRFYCEIPIQQPGGQKERHPPRFGVSRVAALRWSIVPEDSQSETIDWSTSFRERRGVVLGRFCLTYPHPRP